MWLPCHILFCNSLPILVLSRNILLLFILQYIIISFCNWRIVRSLMIELLYRPHNLCVTSKYLGWTLGNTYMFGKHIYSKQYSYNIPIAKISGVLLPTWKFQVFIDQGYMGISIQGLQKKIRATWNTGGQMTVPFTGSLYPSLQLTIPTTY